MGGDPGHSGLKDLDLGLVFREPGGVTLDEGRRLNLAKGILICLALICVGVFVAHGAWPANSGVTDVFELIKVGALPLVTLVVSFYFPKTTV
jgi:hypothetical protein